MRSFSADNCVSSFPERIYLTGYMGAGKSTIGKVLASTLHYAFHDTDRLVEKGFNKKIAQIFQENGEKSFRRAENLVLRTLSQKVQVIVSVGGGTLVTAKSLEIAQQSGIIVYLRAPVRVLYERVIFSPKQRPVIDVPDTEHLFAQTFEQRRFYYEQADITVDTDAQGVKQVVHNILEALRGINP